jgi:hypothetical protein
VRAQLVLKLAAPHRFALFAGASRVARLHAEALDVAVKLTIVVKATGAQRKEVLQIKRYLRVTRLGELLTSHVFGHDSQNNSSLMSPKFVCKVTDIVDSKMTISKCA